MVDVSLRDTEKQQEKPRSAFAQPLDDAFGR
jgi:hypothetical protein